MPQYKFLFPTALENLFSNPLAPFLETILDADSSIESLGDFTHVQSGLASCLNKLDGRFHLALVFSVCFGASVLRRFIAVYSPLSPSLT